jgi:hypothetical protein
MRRLPKLAASLLALVLAACSGESSLPEATGKGSLRAINAIKTSPEIAFLIEERSIDAISFKNASSTASWDDLNYTFNFEVLLAGDTARTRVASINQDIVANKDYTFVISGALATPMISVWENDQREWGENETMTEFRFGHLAASEDPVDIYLAAPGVAPVPGEEVGTAAFGAVLPAFDMAAGEYVVTITAAGDDTDILFLSNPFITQAATSLIISLFDGDANTVAPLALRSFNASSGGTGVLTDSRLAPTIRFFHASKDPAVNLVDIYIEDLLGMPEPTPDLTAPTDVFPLAYTTANEIMAIHIQENVGLATGFHWNLYFLGEPGDPQIVLGRPDRRSIETTARVSLLQTAANHALLDLYIVDRGVDISAEEVSPVIGGIPPSGTPINYALPAGGYDFHLTVSGEKTVVVGPFEVDVVLGDVLDLIVYDVDDIALAKIVEVPPVAPPPP